MGVELAASIVGLTLLGLWIDHRFGTRPVGILVGAGLGIVGGFYNFMRQALLLNQESGARMRPDQPREDDERNKRP